MRTSGLVSLQSQLRIQPHDYKDNTVSLIMNHLFMTDFVKQMWVKQLLLGTVCS